jgi:hypothetical protein
MLLRRPRLLDSRAADVFSIASLLCSALTLPSAARELQISFSPDAPTWRDAVVVTVTSPGPNCTPRLGEPLVSFAGGWFVDIDLRRDRFCRATTRSRCSTSPPSARSSDTNTGQRRVFGNPLGEVPSLAADTVAFETCGL